MPHKYRRVIYFPSEGAVQSMFHRINRLICQTESVRIGIGQALYAGSCESVQSETLLNGRRFLFEEA